MKTRTLMAAGLLLVAVGLISTATFAQGSDKNVNEEWKIALEHAKLAQNSSTAKGVQQHLQHVINCVEGANGSGFEAGPGNPCQGKGNGMMVDAKAAGGKYMQKMHWMQLTSSVAQLCRKATTAEMAKAAAWTTEQVLQQTGKEFR
jgi:hypothetical protein